jgi:hypothetical protein
MSPHVIDEGYWREPLDLTISMTFGGQFFKHFYQHIRPMNSATSEASFHQYTRLPVELQIRVLQLCDAPTLFQLMHTSRHLRTEAKKLFFSDQKTWYRLSMKDYFINCSCPGESIYDVDFLACIQQLDLKCDTTFDDWLPDEACKRGHTGEELRNMNVEQESACMKDFWQTVQRLFPRVKRVILSSDTATIHDEPPVDRCYQKLAQMCPQGIEVSFYGVEKEKEREAISHRRQRAWWRLRTGQEDAGTGITLKQERHFEAPVTIVIPPQKVHRGQIGAFIKSNTLWSNFHGQRFAARMHQAAAVEKYYFEGRHKPFSCSKVDCDTWFEKPEQYTTHLLATGHGEDEAAPGQFKTLFVENAKRIEQLQEDCNRAHRCFWDWWGDYDTEKRQTAIKEVMNQLEHDVLYAQDGPVEDHGLLRMIHEVDFWVGYGETI